MIISEGIIYGCLAAMGCFLTTGILLFFAWIRTFCVRQPLQQEDIFNISSRVQGQDSQWNTRELSQVTISQMQKPPYDDAPPSYEEAMRLAMAASLQTSNTNSASTQIQSVVVEEPKPVGSTSTSS